MITFSGRKASQEPTELRSLINLFKAEGVQRYLEIGARHGDTFHAIMKELEPGSFGVAVDLPQGAWGGKGSLDALKRAVLDLTCCYREAVIVVGDSQAPDIISRVASLGPFDAVFIDGDHRYDAVRKDFLNYGAMSRIVCFHDIAGVGVTSKGKNPLPVEVPTLWKEIKTDRPHYEFIAGDSTMGIGVLFR